MGIMRKVTSVSTFGLVDFRSDKERTARYARQARNAAREQVKVTKQQIAAPSVPVPGWYPDQADARFVRYWDGSQWTSQVQPRR